VQRAIGDLPPRDAREPRAARGALLTARKFVQNKERRVLLSAHLRFFGGVDRDRAAASLSNCSRPGDLALVAQLAGQPSIAAHAASYRTGPDRAEVAFLVADPWQGRGLGSIMFSRLAAAAREQGVATLMAQVPPENCGMLTVFERSGHPVQIRPDADVFDVRIETTPLPSMLAA
jgi:GNAT superfamily N-acetyltransferase